MADSFALALHGGAGTIAPEDCPLFNAGRGDVVAVSGDRRLALPFNSTGMYQASVQEGEPPAAAVFAA